jgi:hypothetical protein
MQIVEAFKGTNIRMAITNRQIVEFLGMKGDTVRKRRTPPKMYYESLQFNLLYDYSEGSFEILSKQSVTGQ